MTKEQTQRTFLVLGANGFVGSSIVNRLAGSSGSKVICFDRFSRPQNFLKAPNAIPFKGDFFNEKDVSKALEGVDYLVHCFSSTTPGVTDNSPYLDIDMLKRSVEIIEEAAKRQIKKIIYISSGGAVYGRASETEAVTEDTKPSPISPYGIGKLATENFLEYFRQKYGLPYVVYRLTNPYGPGQIFKNKQGVMPIFLDNIIEGRELSVYGDGSSSRDFIYIEDASKMIVSTMSQNTKHSIYNIGRGMQVSLNEVIKSIEGLTQKKALVSYKEAPSTFVQKTNISISRYSAEFGAPVFTPLEEGLAKTIAFNQFSKE